MSELINLEECKLTSDLEKKLFLINQAKQDLEKKEKKFKQALYEEFKNRGINKFENENIVITRILPTTRETIDSKTFEKEFPKLAKKYVKKSEVKGSLRMKFKTTKLVENSKGEVETLPNVIGNCDGEPF